MFVIFLISKLFYNVVWQVERANPTSLCSSCILQFVEIKFRQELNRNYEIVEAVFILQYGLLYMVQNIAELNYSIQAKRKFIESCQIFSMNFWWNIKKNTNRFSKIFKVPFNGKAWGYGAGSHMYMISLNFRGFFPVVFGCTFFLIARYFLDNYQNYMAF